MNLDETSVLMHHPGKKGLVWLPKRKGPRRRKLQPMQKLSLSAKRQCLTHVAMISNLPEVNKKLPQILLGNEFVIPASAVAELRSTVHSSIKIWRRKSSWVNALTMKDIAAEIVTSLREYKDTHRIVLLVDCCGPHLNPSYITTLANNGIAVVVVPAKLTWLLQPLDTHAFSSFKLAVADKYRRFLMTSESNTVSNLECLKIIAETIPVQLQEKDWRVAFHGNNFGGRDAVKEEVRQSILQCLEWNSDVEIASSLPSLDQFAAVMPKNREAPLSALLKVYRTPHPPLPRVQKSVPLSAAPVPKSANPWQGRLRSSSSLSLVPKSFPDSSAGAASSSEPWPQK